MSQDTKSAVSAGVKRRRPVAVERFSERDALLLTLTGTIDETFAGFGDIGNVHTIVIDVSRVDSMTSFGVRQWLRAIEALPKSGVDLYLLGCPTFFVDQLNMVLGLVGSGRVLTVIAPYACAACGVDSPQTIDVLAHRATVTKEAPQRQCEQCGGTLQFDETPESYFAFVAKRGAQKLSPAALKILATRGLYTAEDAATEKPPSVMKLVHGSVTYFRIKGTIGALFRARPLLVGAEGEIVIDLAEVDHFALSGQREWRRLIKSLAAQVPAITLADVSESFLAAAGDTLTLARHVHVSSLLVPYTCLDCDRTVHESKPLASFTWPVHFDDEVCPTCGGTRRSKLSGDALAPLRQASTTPPAESAKVVAQRAEILSRALTDANVARASNDRSVGARDVILGKYEIVSRVSAGGMAEVFLAKQIGLGGFEKHVAIKRIQNKLLENRQQSIELFLNEAKIAGRLTHPNIVQVLDVGEDRGALYLAMEYVHGRDLRDVMKTLQRTGAVMPLAEACHIVREIAKALHYAYWSTGISGERLSVVHRDVSPHNVILGYDGTVKLVDFGVAMSAITENAQALIVGKWTYMSPETMRHAKTDHRSDLFSLGVILYLLCTGKNPFAGSEPKEIAKKIKTGDYERLSAIAPHLPAELSTLTARLLASNPEFRPQRGEEVVDELTVIIRKYGLQTSGERIAEYLRSVLPAQPPIGSVNELVRVYRDEATNSQDPTRINPAPSSITPSARTSRNPIRVSESFRRLTVETPVPSIPPMNVTFSNPSPVPPARKSTVLLIKLLLSLVLLAAAGFGGYFFVHYIALT